VRTLAAVLTLESLLTLDRAALVQRLCALTSDERGGVHRGTERERERSASRDAAEGRERRYTHEQGHRLSLIVMATAPVERLFWPMDEEALRVARSRGSRFLHALARHALRAMATGTPAVAFADVRALERAGELSLRPDDDYVLAMVNGLGARPYHGLPRAEALRADPDLLERAFWRVFEVEGNRQVSLANVDRFAGGHMHSWHTGVLDLLADATIDRARVLDATLAALGRGFPAYRAGWFTRLHAALSPTLDEFSTRQSEYATLLRAATGQTVTLAVDALSAVEKAGRLDDRVAFPGLAAAVHAPAKSTAVKALKLAARISGRLPTAGEIVVAALRHPHGDVQTAALRHLRQRGEPADRDAIRDTLSGLAPMVAAEARRWLSEEAPPIRTERRYDRAHQPASPDPIAPITDPAELAEAFAILLENPTHGDLIECALCAAARLGPDPDRYAVLARRAARLLRDGPAYEWSLLLDVVARVVLAAAHAPPPPFPMPQLARPLQLLGRRAAAVEAALREGRRFAPCAEPTHMGGWIAPGVLVERLADESPHILDAVAALLRLGPSPAGDPSLVEAATKVPGVLGAALGYALGGPPPDRLARDDRALWIAAARARAPLADDPALLRLAPDLDLAGAGRAPSWRVPFDPQPPDNSMWVSAPPEGVWAGWNPALPTMALAITDPRSDRLPAAPWHPWLATVWPGNVEPILAIALRNQLLSIEERSGSDAGRLALDMLTSTVAELPPLTPHVVAAGLGAPSLAERTAAVDAALALLPHRVNPAALAEAMALLAPAVPLNRWASSLGDLAVAGRGAEVRAVLAALLPALDRATRGLHSLVELLRDEHLRATLPVADAALRDWLAGMAGGSKTASAARTLLAQLA
jgi:hypothetical protein